MSSDVRSLSDPKIHCFSMPKVHYTRFPVTSTLPTCYGLVAYLLATRPTNPQ